jgi:dehydrogenase/reductase SDR family protein 1
VYVTGRTVNEGQAPLPGSIGATAAEVDRRGGRGVAVRCDHADDAQVRSVFDRIHEEHGAVDVLVNNVFALPDGPLFDTPFWEQPIAFWDTMLEVGLRSHYVASVLAAPKMVKAGSGLIVNVSSYGARGFALNVAYGVGKAALDRMTADMAHDLAPHRVAAVSIWPGVVRTERILAMGDKLPFDTSKTQSPVLSGRVVAALAADPKVAERSGAALPVHGLAKEYGIEDDAP